ncbi:MAG: tyrosine-type recombinase/integrase, partial [Thermoleophilia bacterium]|nr:tyrosine-type recombinase/integrase [Thermoleophilia bacterium]
MATALIRTSTPGIYKRGAHYAVVLRDANGKQFKRTARTLAEARALKSSLAADVARGELQTESRIGFRDYADSWLETFAGRSADGIREHSLVEYRRVLELHAIPFFGNRPLCELRLPDIKRYAAHIAKRGISANTVRLYVGPVRVMLATAVEDGLLRSNPATDFRNVYGTRKRIDERTRALSDDELTKLIAEIPEEYQLVVRFLAESGLRIGEATELRWHDFDFDAREVSVERRYYENTVDAPKSRNG